MRQIKLINGIIACYREDEGSFAFIPNGDHVVFDDSIPWVEVSEPVVRLSDNSLAFKSDPRFFADAKTQKKAEIAAARYEREIAGVEVNGVLIDTGRDSQALITGAALAAMLDENYSLNWKTTAGFIHLSAPEIIAVAQAVRDHVQACFDREGELVALVDAAKTAEDLDEIIISWPE